jgi:GTP 3',8-cyclase
VKISHNIAVSTAIRSTVCSAIDPNQHNKPHFSQLNPANRSEKSTEANQIWMEWRNANLLPHPPGTPSKAIMADVQPRLHDQFGRHISYVRLSLTDRCDMRCRYCMAEDMAFLPRSEILSLEEIVILAEKFVERGVKRIRLTGGEPLARRGAVDVATQIGRLLGRGLDELTLTTNATRLAEHAAGLHAAGIKRINISLDTRDPEKFRYITRTGDLPRVLDGIEAAKTVGFAIKINMVALKGLNDDEIAPMLAWCVDQGFDLSLIETMPLGAIDDDRVDRFLPLTEIKAKLDAQFTLVPATYKTGGPARYWSIAGTDSRLGLISPLTHNFCESCNRIRVSASGQLYMCLGHDDHVDLRAALRGHDPGAVDAAVDRALGRKPRAHDFHLETPATMRHMNVTGG